MGQSFPSGRKCCVYVVDDDETFRQSLLMLLDAAGWETRGFASALDFLDECPFLAPGALLLDIRMAGMGGLELLESDEPHLLNFAIIMVTGHGDVETAVRSLKSGAVDFLEKPFSGDDLLMMLESSYGQLLAKVDLSKREKDARERVSLLSARESEVLSGLIAGASYKLIARYLGISDRTVEMYRNNMVRKLGAKSTNEALHIGVLAKVQPIDVHSKPLRGN